MGNLGLFWRSELEFKVSGFGFDRAGTVCACLCVCVCGGTRFRSRFWIFPVSRSTILADKEVTWRIRGLSK